jgi:hypothetical protein
MAAAAAETGVALPCVETVSFAKNYFPEFESAPDSPAV